MITLLKYWQWILGGTIGLLLLVWIYGEKRYESGKTAVYQQIAMTPVKRDTVIKYDTIPSVKYTVRWLPADTVYATSDSTKNQIMNLSNNCDSLKALLVEKARPYETKIDSSRFFLYILSHPWERRNDIELQLKPVPYDYPVITNTQILVKDVPWYQHVLEVGGGMGLGYGISRIK